MAFWSRWKKKSDDVSDDINEVSDEADNKENEAFVLSEDKLIQEKPVPVTILDKKRFVSECCESVAELDRQIEEARREYEKVTSYLTDIQKID